MKIGSLPWWVVLAVGAGCATVGFGAGFAGGFLSFAKTGSAGNVSTPTSGSHSTQQRESTAPPLPKFPALKGEWLYSSKVDFFKKFGDGDRTSVTFDGRLGQMYYTRAVATSEANGKPCGMLVSFSDHHVSDIEEIKLSK